MEEELTFLNTPVNAQKKKGVGFMLVTVYL